MGCFYPVRWFNVYFGEIHSMKSLFKLWVWLLFLFICAAIFLSMTIGALDSFGSGYYWGVGVALAGSFLSGWLIFYSTKRSLHHTREIGKNVLFNFVDIGTRDYFHDKVDNYRVKTSNYKGLPVFIIERMVGGVSQPVIFIKVRSSSLLRNRSFYAELLTELTYQVRKDFPRKKVRQAILVNTESVTGFTGKFKEDSFNGKTVLSIKGREGLMSLYRMVESRLSS